ncbi:MAG: o-succinylbenzoate--CoA ligase [Ignavibacteriae bacterium HGW-Ignavibacteriae-3]|nr:MAG: o-succinylbenzoate--CoA ligase [Ignavibacteriae bacterium HGW-Ignavibacteriae-3]
MIFLNSKTHWLSEQTSRQPDKTAFITSERTVSYREFYMECSAATDFLFDLGIRNTEKVGLLYGHNYNFFAVVNALWFIGAVPVPLNTRLLTEELKKQIDLADIKFLLIDANLTEQFSHLNFENKIYFPSKSSRKTYDKNTQILNSTLLCDCLSGGEVLNCSLIMFTSGSTGNSKAVVHTFESLFESVKALDSCFGLSNEDVWLASLPLYHIGGFMIPVRALIAGSAVAFPDSPSHEDIKSGIKKFIPSHISLVPTTLFRLLNENVSPDANLKYAFLGGGPSDKKLISDAVSMNWPIIKVYGSTETCSMITALLPGESKEKLDSSGKVLSDVKITVQETDEILVASKTLFKEYYNDPLSTRSVFKDGWYRTGDIGRIDTDGYLFLDSRREDVIISGGENVSSGEVENVLKSHPSISDAFVFSLDDKTWGQIVCSVLVTDNFNEAEISDFLRTKLAGYKIPKRFFLLKKIPRNELGKVSRQTILKELSLD